MMSCNLTEIIKQWEGMCCLHLQGIYLYISSTNFSAPETTKRRELRLLGKKYVRRDVGESGRGFIRGIILAFSSR
jgi:hypothetical protein